MSVEPLPSFPLMDDEARDHVFERSDRPCDCCSQPRGWRYTPYLVTANDDEPTVCPWCILDGAAAKKYDCHFNTPEDYEAKLMVPMPDREVVEYRTPGFVTWQQDHWKVCCDSACKFMGDATVADLAGRWASLVPALREDMGQCIAWFDKWLTEIAAYGSAPAVYVFQCRKCSKLHFFWDIH